MISDSMESPEARAVGAALNQRSRLRRRHFTRPGRSLAAIAAVVVLFYAVAGYLGTAYMFGDHPRWRGMNRRPTDFGLQSETVSVPGWLDLAALFARRCPRPSTVTCKEKPPRDQSASAEEDRSSGSSKLFSYESAIPGRF
jgi:hypothetical protein